MMTVCRLVFTLPFFPSNYKRKKEKRRVFIYFQQLYALHAYANIHTYSQTGQYHSIHSQVLLIKHNIISSNYICCNSYVHFLMYKHWQYHLLKALTLVYFFQYVFDITGSTIISTKTINCGSGKCPIVLMKLSKN